MSANPHQGSAKGSLRTQLIMWTWVATLLLMFVYAQSAPVSTNKEMEVQDSGDNIRSKRFAHDIYNYLASYQQAHQMDGSFDGTAGFVPHKRFSDLVNYLHMYQQEPSAPMAFVDKDKKDEHDLLPSAPVGWNLLNLNSLEHE